MPFNSITLPSEFKTINANKIIHYFPVDVICYCYYCTGNSYKSKAYASNVSKELYDYV